MRYEDWNHAIVEHFFSGAEPEVPVYLSVDDGLLRELGGLGGPASFEEAVRTQIYGRDPFGLVLRRGREWRRTGALGDPPFVAVLAAVVLAASRMASGAGPHAGRGSYYGPLRQLLGMQRGHGMPDGYDIAMPVLWDDHLAWWLREREQGRRGQPTAARHPTQTYIGWALSQAVLLGTDRVQVALFLSSIGARREDELTEDELLARFGEWARLHRPSTRIQRALASPVLRPVFGAVLAQELRTFDGTARDATGRPCLPLSLTSKDGGLPYRLAVHVPPGFRHGSLRIGDTEVLLPQGVGLVALPDSSLGIPLPGEALEVEAGPVRLLLPARDCYVLQSEDLLGAWTSVGTAAVGLAHRVLVRTKYAKDAVDVMEACGGTGLLRPRRVDTPTGWTLISRYKPAGSAKAPAHLGMLVPLHQQLASLSGGLRLDSHKPIYLAEYAPDLVVPAQPDGQPPQCSVNGIPLTMRERDDLYTARLADVVRTPGTYRAVVGGRTLRFTLVPRYRELPTAPTLTLKSRGGVVPLAPAPRDPTSRAIPPPRAVDEFLAPFDISGAAIGTDLRGELAPLTQMRVTGRILALGTPNVCAELLPEQPPWLEELGLPAYAADLEPLLRSLPFTARWLLRLPRSGSGTVFPLPVLRPLADDGNGDPAYGTYRSLRASDLRWLITNLPDELSVPATVVDTWSAYRTGARTCSTTS